MVTDKSTTETTKKSKKRHLSHIIRLVVALVAIYFAFRGQSLAEVRDVFLNLDISVFALAVALYIAAQFIFVCRWRVLLWAQKIHIDFWPAMKLHFLGLFYNNCLPGSVGGDLLRAWYVTKHTDKKVAAALSVFVDRAIGLACTIGMAFGAYWLIPSDETGGEFELSAGSFDLAGKISAMWPVIAVAAGVGILLLVLMCIMPKGRGLLRTVWGKGSVVLVKSFEAFKLYLRRPLAVALAVLLSLGCQGLAIIGFWLVGRNLGIEAHLKYYFMFFPMSWIIGFIPISIGGAGVMELGLKGMFARVTTVSALQGLVLGLTQRLMLLIVSVPGVVIHMTGRHLPNQERLEAEIIEETDSKL
ncbi:MAG: flippase-like domain-containing protein [Anaerohalosphaeraceae bacterium]|nr:flippase-like domain-containing protein [Anaerohalosphaeraceae bacterium]